MRSVVYDRAESSGAQQVAVTGPQARRPIGRTVWPAVQVPCEHRREQAGIGDEIADRVVLGDLRGAGRRGAGTRGSRRREPARRGRRRTASRSAWFPCPAVWPLKPSAMANSRRPRIRRILVVPPDQAGLGRSRGRQREQRRHLSAQISGFMALSWQPRTASSFRHADSRPGRRANPQNVRSPRLPSRRDRKASDTGITNDERGNGTGGNGSCQLTSRCTPATTSPTSPPARAAAAAPGPCRTTPRPGSRPGSGPGKAPRRSG